MINKIFTVNSEIIKKLFAKLYVENSITMITICWVLASIHLTIIYKCENCINIYDEYNIFNSIVWLSLVIIFIVYIPIVIYFFIKRNSIGKEKDNCIENNSRKGMFGTNQPEVFILPMYLLWVFSSSKLIVILHSLFNGEIREYIILKITILSIILLGSLWAWISFKKTSPKCWSLGITLLAISYIFINVCWEEFLPFLESYFRTWNCIMKSMLI